MFDLEKAITDWKAIFDSIDSIRREDVAELESHLREAVVTLQASKLTEQEAFLIATSRLGHPAKLSGEYCKTNVVAAWNKRVLWMLVGYLAFTLGSAVIGAMASLASSGAAAAGFRGQAIGAVAVTTTAVGWAFFIALAYYQSRKTSAEPDRFSAISGVATCMALLIATVISHLGTMFQAKTIPISEFGESAFWQLAGTSVIHPCVIIASILLISALSERKHELV